MKKALIICLAAISFNALAYEDEPFKMFNANKRRADTQLVVWKVAKDATIACQEETKRRGWGPIHGQVWGCEFDDGPRGCTIITDDKTNLAVLGHEIRHCFQGDWHGE